MRSALWFSCAALLCNCTARAEWPNVNYVCVAKVNKKLTAKQVAIHKVMLLPAGLAFNKIGTRGPEGGTPEGDRLASSFQSALAKELSSRGVEVLPIPPVQADDDVARYALADLQAKYNNVDVQLQKKPGRVRNGQITLGDLVAKFEPGASADALVFIRGSAQVPTAGRKAVGVAVGLGVGIWSGIAAEFSGEIAFVDSKTGEVLAFIEFQREANMTEQTDERFAESLSEALQKVSFWKK